MQRSNNQQEELYKILNDLRKEIKDDIKDVKDDIKQIKDEFNNKFDKIEGKIGELYSKLNGVSLEMTALSEKEKVIKDAVIQQKQDSIDIEQMVTKLDSDVKKINTIFKIVGSGISVVLALLAGMLGINHEHISIFSKK